MSIVEWTVADVTDWAKSHGLSEGTVAKLADEGVDGEALSMASVEDLVALGVKRGPAVKLAAHVKSMMPAMVSEPAGAPALAGAVVAGAAGAVVAPPTAVAEEGMGVDAGLPGGGCPAAAESLEASALPADSVMVAQVPAAPSTAAMGAAPPTPLSGSPGGPLSASPGGPPDGAVGAAVQADAGGPAAPALEPGQQAATGVAQETSGPFTEQRILNYLHAGRSAKDLISAGADKAAVLLALQSDDTLCSEGNWSGQAYGRPGEAKTGCKILFSVAERRRRHL